MKPYVKIALFVVFFIAVAGIGAALYLFNKQQKDLRNVKPDFVISANDLQKAFEANESAATAKFVKKIIEVSGIVESVKTGEGNVLNLTLKTESDLSSVICTFIAGADPSKMMTGSRITLRGECTGFLMDVVLDDCFLVK